MKTSLEKFIDGIVGGLMPHAKELSALENSKDASINIESDWDIDYQITGENEARAQVSVAPRGSIAEYIDASAEAGRSTESTVQSSGKATIAVSINFVSDGKQGLFSRLLRRS